MNTQLSTYSFYDYGMTPAYQGSFEAPNREEAGRLAVQAGLELHRVTPVLGVRILVSDLRHSRAGASSYLTPKFATKLEAWEHLRQEPPPPMHEPRYEYVYPTSWNQSYDAANAVTREIEDVDAEQGRYLPALA